MTTAEELLCRRSWRLTRSSWMLWGVLSFGMLSGIGWLYTGARSKNRLFMIVGAGLAVNAIAYFTVAGLLPALPGKGVEMTDAQNSQAVAQGAWIAATWIGSTVAAWFANRKWLVWRARKEAGAGPSTPWYAQATAGSTPPEPSAAAQVADRIDAALASPGRAVADPAAAVDLNSATQQEIAGLPGIDAEVAARIVRAREQDGAFGAVSDLVTRAGVQPHLVADLRGAASVGGTATETPVASAPSSSNAAPGKGRKLEF